MWVLEFIITSKIIEIDKKILEQTTECKKNFACLSGNIGCEVEQYKDNEIIVAKNSSYADCYYAMPINDSCYCTCPVRKEIFLKNRDYPCAYNWI